ncbi:PASTA domain-containing protein [Streptomyces sp. NPDC051940]|uniref:PASTA domain-containing protein n=1 Tax=Streptomyces sp. NPDC051940 TaxID=3155675 RepID=UPI0034124F89
MSYPEQGRSPKHPYDGYGQPPQDPDPQGMSTGAKVGLGCVGVFAAVVVLGIVGAVVGAGDDDTGGSRAPAAGASSSAPAPDDARASGAPAPKSSPEPEQEPEAEVETAALPDLVGKGLQDAQDTSQAAGFYYLDSHDVTGQGRFSILDRNWKVCDQSPAAGEHPTDTKVDFGVVKVEESCP